MAATALLGLLMILATVASPAGAQASATQLTSPDPYAGARSQMIDSQVRGRGITEPRVISAMEMVPRHLFVPRDKESRVYEDGPVEIAPGQTLSQAYVSARMISLLELDENDRVLEIGTGSGYDAALLSKMAKEVLTIEIDPRLGERAQQNLERLGYSNVEVKIGDGYRGWPEKAPFDAILLTAAPQRIPEPLFEQLAVGGKMVVAVGYSLHQDLKVITKTGKNEREVRRVSLISLAPMRGEIDDPSNRRR
ncbi:MAG: protein-L-isoaspartate(D-aspartate) O-methyltransferase [Holophagales bacterium]|nr:protein-L-isoaspartate(D-aspartate) O-methyltransferase [Holophagales bacterium]